MSRFLIFLILGFCCINFITAQTFQYSRGWTNGKRSSSSAASAPINNNNNIPTEFPSQIPLRQMTNPIIMTASELNNRERLLQHIIRNPCEVRMALMSSHNFKLPNDDYFSSAADLLDDDAINRFKRELDIHN